MATSDDDGSYFNRGATAAAAGGAGLLATAIAAEASRTNPPMPGEAEAEASVHAAALQNAGVETGPAEGGFCTNSVDHIYGTICSETPAVETTTEVASTASVGLFDIITSIF